MGWTQFLFHTRKISKIISTYLPFGLGKSHWQNLSSFTFTVAALLLITYSIF
jgi:hypothetical protein